MTVEEYLSNLTTSQLTEYKRIKKLVTKLVPEAEETISYGMPAFKHKGKYLVGFAAFKSHMGLFPTPGPIEALKDKLGDFKLAKGTIQFTEEKPIPESVVREIVLTRLAEISKD